MKKWINALKNGMQNGNIRTAVTKINFDLENIIFPSIKVLAEGQATLQDQLDRIEAKLSVRDEIIVKKIK